MELKKLIEMEASTKEVEKRFAKTLSKVKSKYCHFMFQVGNSVSRTIFNKF